MAKPFKIFLIVVGLFVALIVGAAIAVPMFFDPNDYKGEVTAAAKENTGRELVIAGDIKLSVFPWLGVTLADATLENAKGFGPEPFAQLKSMDVRVKLLPLLFERSVEIGKVSVDGLSVNLVRKEDGTSNWDDLAAGKKEPDEAPKAEAPGEETPIKLAVGGLDITNVAISFSDRQANKAYKLEKFSLNTGEVTLKDPIKLALDFVASASEPKASAHVMLETTVAHDLDAQVYEARDLNLHVIAEGAPVPDGKQEVFLKGQARFDQKAGIAQLTQLVLDAMGAKISSDIKLDQKADTLAMSGTVIEMHGVKVNADVNGTGVTGESPLFSGKLNSGTFNPREVATKLGVELPPMQDATAMTQVSFASDFSSDTKSAKLDNLKVKLDQTTATGHLHVTDLATQAISFALKVDSIDADRYMAPPPPESEKKKDEKGEDFRKTELPIAALDQVNAKGRIDIGALTLKKAKLSNVVVLLDAPKGKVKTQELKAKFYGGTLAQTAKIQPGPKPTYTMTAGLAGVDAAPLLKDFSGKSYLSGIGDFQLNFASGGTTVGDVLKGMNGSVSSAFLKGAVEGFNLKHKIQKAKATLNQEAPPETTANRTEFSDLKGAGTITNGVLKTQTLKATGTDYNLVGDGDINLGALTIDYVLKPTYSGSAGLKDLGGVTVPVSVKGSLFSPEVKVNLVGALKDKVKTEIKQEVQQKKEEVKEKAIQKLGDFLNRQSKPKTEPAAPKPEPKAAPATTTEPAKPAEPAAPAEAEPATEQ